MQKQTLKVAGIQLHAVRAAAMRRANAAALYSLAVQQIQPQALELRQSTQELRQLIVEVLKQNGVEVSAGAEFGVGLDSEQNLTDEIWWTAESPAPENGAGAPEQAGEAVLSG